MCRWLCNRREYGKVWKPFKNHETRWHPVLLAFGFLLRFLLFCWGGVIFRKQNQTEAAGDESRALGHPQFPGGHLLGNKNRRSPPETNPKLLKKWEVSKNIKLQSFEFVFRPFFATPSRNRSGEYSRAFGLIGILFQNVPFWGQTFYIKSQICRTSGRSVPLGGIWKYSDTIRWHFKIFEYH